MQHCRSLSGNNGIRYGGNGNKKINIIKDDKWVDWDSLFQRRGIVNNVGIKKDE